MVADRAKKIHFIEQVIDGALDCFTDKGIGDKHLSNVTAQDCEWSARVDFNYPWAQHALYVPEQNLKGSVDIQFDIDDEK